MSFGTRFRSTSETTSSLKTTVGAALVGAALLGGSLGLAGAQDASPEASPEASPMASPVATSAWIEAVLVEEFPELKGDSTTVGVKLSDTAAVPLTILGNPTADAPDTIPTIETRPFVNLQVANGNDLAMVVVVLQAPEEFSAVGFTLPQDEAELPEGVTPVAAFNVGAMETVDAILDNLEPGTYVLATTSGLAQTFAVIPVVDLDVPDLFATPEASPES